MPLSVHDHGTRRTLGLRFQAPTACAFAALACLATAAAAPPSPLAFNRDVRPILSKSCFACHGPDSAHGREGGLRLDLREPALAGGDSGRPAITPGKPELSEIVRRITSTDPLDQMPPPDSHLSLAPADADILRQWIAEGAPYEAHWSFVAPSHHPLPPGAHPVDHWINQALADRNLRPNPEADRHSLIRRLSFDLTGLPPSPGEIHDFVHDPRADAYQRLVERLLASPRFGEHFAASWLDASRYADTNGYSIDGGRHQWLWRDWVIRSFNDNQPFDQFLTEQLAGDLLPNATEAQIVATGFNRNHAITHEGGTIPEENLTNYAADRVKTSSEVFLGLTMACAQCHDHKFDPVSIREYYQFFAFFNTLDDAGLDGDGGNNARPSIRARSVLTSPEEIAALTADLEAARAAFAEPLPQEQLAWERDQLDDLAQRGAGLRLVPLKALSVTAPNGSPDRIRIDDDDGSVTIAHGDFSAYNILARLPDSETPIHGLRVVFSPSPNSNGTLGFGNLPGLEGNFHLGGLTCSTSPFPAANVDLNASLAIRRISASTSHPNHPPQQALHSDPLTGWAPATGATTPQHLTATFATPVHPASTPYLTTELLFNLRGGTSPARFQMFALFGSDDGSPHPDDVTAALLTPGDERSPQQSALLQHHFHHTGLAKQALRHHIVALEQRLAALTDAHPVLVMNTADNPRTTHVLDRGVYSSPLEAVTPGTPAALPPLSLDPDFDPATGTFADRAPNRLDLARWMTRPDHPLTARVAVNRLWEHFFGRALSASSADLGSQGQWPSHPPLLDQLALDFIASGWDRKQLIRTIVSSDAYRRSSESPPHLLAADPANEWLARGPRFRLSAEQIRDQALALSGLLVERLGGPSVRPYQPGDLWRQVSHYGSTPATAQTFIRDHGEHLYRRSLYTYWKRTLPPTNLSAFDAPNREVCSITRTTTNTPLQALVTLNDPQFVEAARAFASTLLAAPHADDPARLASAFEHATSRPPKPDEARLLLAALARERAAFAADPQAAAALIGIGDSIPPETLDPAELAAWTQLTTLLLNLSETLTRR